MLIVMRKDASEADMTRVMDYIRSPGLMNVQAIPLLSEGRLLSDELADVLNLPPSTTGYLVKTVAKGSPAEAVGLRGGTKIAVIDGEQLVVGGDIILKVQGIPVSGLAEYEKVRQVLARMPSGDTMTVTVLRAGRLLELSGRKP